jgi:hypothetical protein
MLIPESCQDKSLWILQIVSVPSLGSVDSVRSVSSAPGRARRRRTAKVAGLAARGGCGDGGRGGRGENQKKTRPAGRRMPSWRTRRGMNLASRCRLAAQPAAIASRPGGWRDFRARPAFSLQLRLTGGHGRDCKGKAHGLSVPESLRFCFSWFRLHLRPCTRARGSPGLDGSGSTPGARTWGPGCLVQIRDSSPRSELRDDAARGRDPLGARPSGRDRSGRWFAVQ